jgi:hypothetical protein
MPRDRLTTTIERVFLREIVAGRKKVEYRALKPYWTKRLYSVGRPFELRLINVMQKAAPEVTVLISRVVEDQKLGHYRLHKTRVLSVKNWDRRRECPTP